MRTLWMWLWVGCAAPLPDATARADEGTARSVATPAAANPVELGSVAWHRGYDAAKAEAARVGRPLLVLFDEVPGCSTVRNYGATALSDPFVIDAAASLFVPVVVYNNVAGDDRRVLESFGEPAWNNPVVRFLGPDGAALGDRHTGDWSTTALLQAMVRALETAERPVPEWLSLVAWEREAPQETATYAMYCFWSGEAHLGAHPAVLKTDTGFQEGREVVRVTYDPTRVRRSVLDSFAARASARPLEGGTFRGSAKDDRYQLKGTPWATVPMTRAQASRVNADVGNGRDPSRWLAPHQLAR